MEVLNFLGALVAFVLLWKRVSTLETTVADLSGQIQSLLPADPEAARESKSQGQPKPRPAQRVPSPAPAIVQPSSQAVAPSAVSAAVPARAYLPESTKAESAAPILRMSFNFEDIFGRLLPIWVGGITLAVAGFFLVRYSIDQGMLTPTVRVILGFLFGGALIAAAELANRFAERVTDPRVAQALAGAGLATLYASFYLAGSGYALIGSTIAFIGLAAVTAGAIALSYRFGLPSAVLGLVGGFAAPMLAGGNEANVPLLATYLGLVTAGLVLTGERQKRAWLGIVALFSGLGWGAFLLLTGASGAADAIAIGGYLVLLGAVIPALAVRAFPNMIVRLVASGLATVQMAVLIAQGDFTLLAWSLFAMLCAALALLGWREARLREGSAIAALTGLLLLAHWPHPATGQFALVACVLTAIFAAVPLAHLWRGKAKPTDIAMISGFPPGMLAAIYWQFGEPSQGSEPVLAFVAAALAMFPCAAAWREWARDALPLRTLAALTSAAILLTAACILVLPWWGAAVAGSAAVAVLTKLLAGHAGHGERALIWSFAGLTLVSLLAWPGSANELSMLTGQDNEPELFQALIRWFAAAGAFALVAWRETLGWARRLGEAVAAFLAYGALAQIVPVDALAWMAALGAIAVAWWLSERNGARVMLLAITGLWALLPLAVWTYAGTLGLTGESVLVTDLPSWREVLRAVLPFAGALAALGLRKEGASIRLGKVALAALPVAVIVLHILYKQVFAIGDAGEFAALGLAERTVWQALLGGVAIALLNWRGGPSAAKQVAIGIAATSLIHFGWFTLALHNPLLTEQATGSWPIVNWLLPAYGVAIALLAVLRSPAAERFALLHPVFDGAIMVLVSLLALSELRHVFAGSTLTTAPIGQTEDLLRSLLGIVLAAAFLWWGSRTRERSWRIGSLVLMLLAVAKVFVFDAAGLEGLARIASFMVLGSSLIGIGWFYNRQLRGNVES